VQEIRVGDEIFRFPDNMSDAEIKAAMQKRFGAPKGVIGRTIEWFKGGKREENIPLATNANLGLPREKAAKMVSLLATTASDERLQSGIKGIIPGAEFDKDQYGNLVVIAPVYREGEPTQQYTRFYPNPQGLDVTDIMQAAGAVTAAQAIAGTGGLLGIPVAGVTGGALIGATEAGLIEAASSYLSGAPYKFSDIPLGAAGGAAGAKAAQALASLANVFRRSPSSLFDQSGRLDPKVASQMRDLGVDPNSVTQDTLKQILKQVRQGADPEEAKRLAQAQGLPVPVPLTQGAVTGSQGQQIFEDLARKGAYGQTAESMMRGRELETQQALQQNIPAIQERIAGTSPIVTELGQAGRAAQETLEAQRSAASAQADVLYETARGAGPAFLDEDFAIQFAQSARTQMGDNFELQNVPKTSGFLNQLDELISEGAGVRDLFALRKKITSLGAEIGEEGKAARQLKDIFDQEMAGALESSLIFGDEATVKAWQNAISNYKDFAATWKSKGGILNALTEKTGKDGEIVLSVSPDRASNYIFGVSTGRLSSNPEIARNLLTLQKKLPEQQWNSLRQEAFVRLTDAGRTARAGQDMFSGVSFRKNWKKLSKENPAMIKALFTPAERSLIEQFANVSAQATGGAVNASNSAAGAFNLLGRLASAFGSTNFGQFATRVAGANMVRSAYGGARAAGALAPTPTPPSGMFQYPTAGAGLGGQAVTTEEFQDPVTRQIQRTTGINLVR
jgi:hypothetical protein